MFELCAHSHKVARTFSGIGRTIPEPSAWMEKLDIASALGRASIWAGMAHLRYSTDNLRIRMGIYT